MRADLVFVDVADAIMAEGVPRDIFRPGGLHMNATGYAIWTGFLKAALDKPFPTRAWLPLSRQLPPREGFTRQGSREAGHCPCCRARGWIQELVFRRSDEGRSRDGGLSAAEISLARHASVYSTSWPLPRA